MADVIPFPSTNSSNDNLSKDEKFQKLKLYKPKTSVECLSLYKEYLTTEDYEEILCCIMDKDYYYKADYQVKNMVDSYFEFKY